MTTCLIYSYASNQFLHIPKSEWDEVKDEGTYVLIKQINYSIDSEVDVAVLAMNREVSLLR